MNEKDMTATAPTAIRVTRYLAGPALALGLALGSSAVANAEPISENTIKSECKAAGGTYITSKQGRGVRFSTCTYNDINGTTHTDDYVGGEYSGTNPA
jgi:hypothetical protein